MTNSKMQIRALSDLPTPPVPTWLARGFVPRNEITVLVGEEGIGKSLTWVLLAAHVTTGSALPAFNLPVRAPGDVVLIITEDSAGEVLARLLAAGADTSRIHLFSEAEDGSGTPVFPESMPVLYKWAEARQLNPALVVVDAWLDTVEAGLQVRNTQHGRQALAPWKEAATRLQTSVILVTHTNRMDSANTRDLLGSTVALRQKARMILFAAKHPEDGHDGFNHVWIGPEKSNTTGTANAVRFDVLVHRARRQTDDDPGTVATLANPSDAGSSIRHLLQEWRMDQQQAEKEPNGIDRAEAWVRDFMRGKDREPAATVKDAARAAGFGQRAVSVAMGRVGESRPDAPGQPWMFSLRQSVQSVGNTATTAHIAKTAHTGADTGLSLQSVRSMQSPQRYPDAANTGLTCKACGEPLSPVLAAVGLHAGCEAVA